MNEATTAELGARDPDDSGEMPLMVDRFMLEDEIGAGGMGRVYLAYDPTLDRRVALKLLRKRIGMNVDAAHARMAREARAMAKLRHPNVVTVHEVGTEQRGLFIVMEYVAGQTLREWLAKNPESGWRQIVEMFVLAGRGLAAAHQAGLVHRDFKPENVLVGDDGRVIVVDFGIANVQPDEVSSEIDDSSSLRLTREGALLGTPPYMAPEQHQSKPVDARTDQFAFCAAMYEALCGTRPFAGKTVKEIAEHANRGELTPPLRTPPSRIYAALLRGLRADPAERFPSMAALLDELGRERASRLWWLAPVALVGAATAVWFAVRPDGVAPKPVGLIAVEPMECATLDPHAGWADSVSDIVALTLSDVDGIKAVGPSDMQPDRVEHPDFAEAETRLGARVIVRGWIVEHAGRFHAQVVLIASDGGLITTVAAEDTTLANTLDGTTRAIARALAPDRRLDPRHAAKRAKALYRLGETQLRNINYSGALPFLEQAVVADPKLFEGWYALALARSWVLAPERRVFEAIEAARANAPGATERTLVDGVAHYLHKDHARARAVLEPLVDSTTASPLARRDALYFLGEAHWHDGHHKLGVGYLRRALDVDMTFKLPVLHVAEYATVNRDIPALQPYAALLATATSQFRETAEFVQRHYDELERSGTPGAQFTAKIVLGRTPSPELEVTALGADTVLRYTYRAAQALERNDTAAAHGAVEQVWKQVNARKAAGELADNTYYSLGLLGDVLVCGGAADEARRLVAFLAEQSKEHPVRNYSRISILTAALISDPTWVVRRELTDRERTLADAIDAELAGNPARAAELLEQIVRDPSPTWDYPERVALLRNLRALRRRKESDALCADTMAPAMFQMAFLPTRRACRDRGQ